MSPDAAIDIFQTSTQVVLRPDGQTSDGHFYPGPVSVTLAWPVDAETLGKTALKVLQESQRLRFSEDRMEMEPPAKGAKRRANLLASLHIADMDELVRRARYIALQRYGDEVDVGHSEAVTAKPPEYRMFRKTKTLKAPSAQQLGQEIIAGLDRCTIAKEW